MRTRALTMAVCAVALGSAGGVAIGEAGPASDNGPEKLLFRLTDADGTHYRLTVGNRHVRLDGRVNVVFSMDVDEPERTTTDSDGRVSVGSSSGGVFNEAALGDRRRKIELHSFPSLSSCRAVAVFGSVVRSATRVIARRADGSTRRLRRLHPPRSWHYRGWLIGTFIGAGPETVRVSVFDRKGRRLGSAPVFNDLGCGESTPGS